MGETRMIKCTRCEYVSRSVTDQLLHASKHTEQDVDLYKLGWNDAAQHSQDTVWNNYFGKDNDE